jgi:two-component system response regulator MtrA
MAKKLLMIDDQAGITRVVELIARQLGIEFRAVNSSLAATEAFIDYRPDVVILDMIMPEKDGIDVLNEILCIDTSARIVLTSGFGEGFLRLAKGVAVLHDAERISVLQKPFRRNELVRLLEGIADEQS